LSTVLGAFRSLECGGEPVLVSGLSRHGLVGHLVLGSLFVGRCILCGLPGFLFGFSFGILGSLQCLLQLIGFGGFGLFCCLYGIFLGGFGCLCVLLGSGFVCRGILGGLFGRLRLLGFGFRRLGLCGFCLFGCLQRLFQLGGLGFLSGICLFFGSSFRSGGFFFGGSFGSGSLFFGDRLRIGGFFLCSRFRSGGFLGCGSFSRGGLFGGGGLVCCGSLFRRTFSFSGLGGLRFLGRPQRLFQLRGLGLFGRAGLELLKGLFGGRHGLFCRRVIGGVLGFSRVDQRRLCLFQQTFQARPLVFTIRALTGILREGRDGYVAQNQRQAGSESRG